MTCYRILKKSNTTKVTSGAGTAYPSRAPEFTPCGIRVVRSLVFCVVFRTYCLSFLSFFFWPLCCLFFNLALIYNTFIFVGVHNTETNYVDTIPVVQEQLYDQYDIAHCVETSLLINTI